LLEQEIVPLFYDRNSSGLPRNWIAKMRNSMAKLAPEFSGNRMVREYVESIYLPAAATYRTRSQNRGALAKQLWEWERQLRLHWQGIHYGNLQVVDQNSHYVFELQVYLGDIPQEHVQVQVFAASTNKNTAFCQTMQCGDPIAGASNGYVYIVTVPADRPAQDYTPRVVPYFDGVQVPAEMSLIHWQR
jgi:starch phosphorylase